jgi:hypothetical protein
MKFIFFCLKSYFICLFLTHPYNFIWYYSGIGIAILGKYNQCQCSTILTVGIVFQYNTSRIVHLWHEALSDQNMGIQQIFGDPTYPCTMTYFGGKGGAFTKVVLGFRNFRYDFGEVGGDV